MKKKSRFIHSLHHRHISAYGMTTMLLSREILDEAVRDGKDYVFSSPYPPSQPFCMIKTTWQRDEFKTCNDSKLSTIDLFHNGDQIWYSFVFMLISLINLAAMGTIQKNVLTKVRPVGLVNINTKGYYYAPPFMKVVYTLCATAKCLSHSGNVPHGNNLGTEDIHLLLTAIKRAHDIDQHILLLQADGGSHRILFSLFFYLQNRIILNTTLENKILVL